MRLHEESAPGLKALRSEVVIPCAKAQGFYPGSITVPCVEQDAQTSGARAPWVPFALLQWRAPLPASQAALVATHRARGFYPGSAGKRDRHSFSYLATSECLKACTGRLGRGAYTTTAPYTVRGSNLLPDWTEPGSLGLSDTYI